MTNDRGAGQDAVAEPTPLLEKSGRPLFGFGRRTAWLGSSVSGGVASIYQQGGNRLLGDIGVLSETRCGAAACSGIQVLVVGTIGLR